MRVDSAAILIGPENIKQKIKILKMFFFCFYLFFCIIFMIVKHSPKSFLFIFLCMSFLYILFDHFLG